jgi:hypothetical protein
LAASTEAPVAATARKVRREICGFAFFIRR